MKQIYTDSDGNDITASSSNEMRADQSPLCIANSATGTHTAHT